MTRLKIRVENKSEFVEKYMKIMEVKNRTSELIQQLLEVWEKSVNATHFFLSDSEIKNIKKYVPRELEGVHNLIIAKNEKGCPVAFMGIENSTLEMLFITPEERGKGLGKSLIQYGRDNYKLQCSTVNEQNTQAIAFYEHMGFKVYKRSERDEQGNPYPLLYMSHNRFQFVVQLVL